MEDKFKLAVCLFGHLRTYKRCAPFLHKNLLNRYDCDLFMHTWTMLDHNTKSWHNATPMEGKTNRDHIINAYGELKGLKIEQQNPRDCGNVRIKPNCKRKETEMSLFGIDSMFHSIREANRLCEEYAFQNKIEYDLVLCIRPDIWLKKPVDIREILEVITEKEISQGFFACANEMSKLVRGFESLGGNDCFFFATPNVMSDVLKNTTQIPSNLKDKKQIQYCPEYELIKTVAERGWVPYRVCLRAGDAWEICRSTSFNFRRQIMRVRVRKNYIRIHLLQVFMRQILQLRLSIFNFEFDVCIGTSANNITDE